jgi:hypothetical protein
MSVDDQNNYLEPSWISKDEVLGTTYQAMLLLKDSELAITL